MGFRTRALLAGLLFTSLPSTLSAQTCACDASLSVSDAVFSRRTVVTNEAKGARCAVSADFDGDGALDLVSASSTDNTVAWYRNEGGAWSGKLDITYLSNGARVVTTADVDADGDEDVVAASYYDDTIRWFENDGSGGFDATHIITTTAVNAQGVHAADLDGDGDVDLASASSGDNTVAVYINVDKGKFCEIKRIVDDNAVGVRTVVAADLNGDGHLDLASASKDDHTVAWYPNDGAANFGSKIIISDAAMGAYSLVARDIEGDGDTDLIVASNGDDTVALWRNDGSGVFSKEIIFTHADFVLSVTAFDFDRDGDMDVASASFFDGYIRWYENLDGNGGAWQNHTLYVGDQGHYVSTGDMDADGDEDLIAVTHSENRVQIFYAATACDVPGEGGSGGGANAGTHACCRLGQRWDGSACVACTYGTYGILDSDGLATCETCPTTCTVEGLILTPSTCSGVTGCEDASASAALCDCPANHFKSNTSDTCEACPAGQTKLQTAERPLASFGADSTMWEGLLNTCQVEEAFDLMLVLVSVAGSAGFLMLLFVVYKMVRRYRKAVAASRAYDEWLQEQVDSALSAINKIGFCVCFLPLSALKKMGKLTPHEACRNGGDLVMLDTYDEVIAFIQTNPTAFFSHQWLARSEPDPNNEHFSAIIQGAQALCEKEGVDPDELYCWIDYACIPQANDSMKQNSISSIAVYASVCRFFVAVAPTIQRDDLVFDVDSYQQRGWCRLEQWARLSVGGLKAVFVYNGVLNDIATHEEWHTSSIRVLQGNFADPEDKRKLVPIILGLWAKALRNRQNGSDEVGVYELVKFNKQEVFPPEYFGSLVSLIEEKVEKELEDPANDDVEERLSESSATPKRSKARARTDRALFQAFKAGQGADNRVSQGSLGHLGGRPSKGGPAVV